MSEATGVGTKPYFNPRSSCEERRRLFSRAYAFSYFNPRSSCEERRQHVHSTDTHAVISIHAPHARSDACSSAPTA